VFGGVAKLTGSVEIIFVFGADVVIEEVVEEGAEDLASVFDPMKCVAVVSGVIGRSIDVNTSD
jgi:hypothetical protein